MTNVFVCEHTASEWSRMARDAYHTGRNDLGHRFSVAAAVYWGRPCRCDVFDTLQTIYRRWLIGGWQLVENPY